VLPQDLQVMESTYMQSENRKSSLVSDVRRRTLGNESGALTFNMTGHV